jgi:thiol-disulfide isomerase/thioredoxin
MALVELGSAQAVQDLIQSNANVVVTFSAHWCGPCNASKPALVNLAETYATSTTMDVKFGIVYESDLGEDIHKYSVKAFPTYVLFQNEKEVNRVQGANLPGVQEMVEAAGCKKDMTGGETLGGGAGSAAVLSPAQAREARLAKFAVAAPVVPVPAESVAVATTEADVDMKDANDDAKPAAAEEPASDPAANLSPEDIKTLTESMGFSLIKAQKGLLFGTGTVEGAVEWLMEHQDDMDIEEPIPAGGGIAHSYKCNECGKVLSNMANLELHANKTGHSDFEESTSVVKPLTAEEKVAKIAEIKDLLKAKRIEREEAEKVDDVAREIERRTMGKEMIKTKEQLDSEQRKREAYLRKKEKDASLRERERIRAQLANDKAERLANKGKLGSRLGVDGYNPDAIQYDLKDAAEQTHTKKKAKPDPSKIDDYIKTVSGYKAGGDGGKCLKILKVYVGNVVDNPQEEKFKTINMENKAFKTKVKPFIGAKNLLMAVGFKQNEGGDALVLEDDADTQLLADTKTKLEKGVVAYA